MAPFTTFAENIKTSVSPLLSHPNLAQVTLDISSQ
jgi:hypothetical protein